MHEEFEILKTQAARGLPRRLDPLLVRDAVDLVHVASEEGVTHPVLRAPADDVKAVVVVAGQDHAVAALDRRGVRVPDRGREARKEARWDLKADVGHAALIDGSLHVLEVSWVDLKEGVDLMGAAVGRGSFIEEVGQDVLKDTALIGFRLGRVEARDLLVEVQHELVRLSVLTPARAQRPDLKRVVVARARAVPDLIVEHHTEVRDAGWGIVDRRRQISLRHIPHEQRTHVRDLWIECSLFASQFKLQHLDLSLFYLLSDSFI